MTISQRLSALTAQQRETLAERLGAAAGTVAAEPVAVIGIGCRLPGGVASPDDLWQLLAEGRDVVAPVPEGRRTPGDGTDALDAQVRERLHRGGFLDDVAHFDAEFFGISPREAEAMDPQQRLLLEVAWETLEHAGTVPARLAGSRTGVFVGAYYNEYLQRGLADSETLDAYTLTGGLHSVLAGRLSYVLDLRGPCLAVDSACSSSLTAVHLACQSLRLRESDTALAGGVNLILDVGISRSLEEYGLLAQGGRCRTFDAGADGIVRTEGCALVLLKRLSDALRDQDRVLAVVRGSAVNQDGRSNGLTAPSGTAQRDLLRDALTRSGVDPAHVGMIETHGTGTALGDPIEVEALAEVYGAGQSGRCALGAVKTNLGHSEAVSGVTGLIKTVLAVGRGVVPRNLHFTELNPNISLDGTRLFVPTEDTAWPVEGPPRLAAVSAFGMGGTNAHLLVEQAPAPRKAPPAPTATATADAPLLFPLSGATDAHLRGAARRLAEWLTGPGADTPLTDVGHTLALRRAHHAARLTVVAGDRPALLDRLHRFLAGEIASGNSEGTVSRAADRGVVWVFSGHGSQWTGMGAELLAHDPAFARVVDELDPVYAEETGTSLRAALREDLRTAPADRVQPLLFALQVALAEVWRAHGVRPSAVIGHSMGEIAAAVVAGALTRTDGARLICRRSLLLRAVAGHGAMAALDLDADATERLLAGREGLSAAILAAPDSTVVSGPPDAVDALVADATAAGINVRRLASDVAFHSPAMDPLCAQLRDAIAELPWSEPDLPFYSSTYGGGRHTGPLDTGHWVANLRNPVRFGAAVAAAAADGHRLFAEISPHPVVARTLRRTLDSAGADDAVVVASLRRDEPQRATLLEQLGTLHCHGVELDWTRVHPHGGPTGLPTTAFQRRRHWRAGVPAGAVAQRRTADGPLGVPAELAAFPDARVWERPAGPTTPVDHDACLENAWAAARATGLDPSGITDFALRDTPPAGAVIRLQTTVRRTGPLTAEWRLHWRAQDGTWHLLADAELAEDGRGGVPADWVYRTEWRARPLPEGRDRAPGRWLVVDGAGLGDSVRDLVESRGGTAVSVPAGDLLDLPPQELAQRLPALDAVDHVLYCAALDTPPDEPESPVWARRLTVGLLRLARLLAVRGHGRPRLHLVTRYAQTVGDEPRVAPAQAVLWGLGRGLAVELTEVWGGLTDLDDTDPAEAARLLLAEATRSDGEDQVAFRAGRRHVTRLVRGKLDDGPSGTLGPDGCHLVVGASGSIGPSLIDRLATLGARHLVLLTRRELTGPAADTAARLRAGGTAVTEVRADVADGTAMTALFARFGADLPPLHGVFNAAMAGGYTELADLTDEDIALMLRPKVDGSVLLHRLSAGHEVRHFVLFSSTAALLGARGLTHYAAANYFLDSLARHRRALGQPALVIDWGIWGEAFGQVHYSDLMAASGLRPMPDTTAVRALDSLLFDDGTHAVIAAVDWPVLADAYRSRIALHLIDEVAPERKPTHRPSAPGQEAARVLAATGAARARLLQEFVRATVAGLLGFDSPSRLGTDQRFFQIGMDSLTASRTQAQLARDLGHDIPAAAVFNYPTVEALTEYLLEELTDDPAEIATPGTTPPETAPAAQDTPAEDLSEDELIRRLTERLGPL
ncbi:type I polyketide synthase [Streptomyces sp. NPDC050803]|uniref:type I polyketide synthase n=1 Tax=unclassified Streptomyces TaxID=2593676 RepID=UPI00342A5FC0